MQLYAKLILYLGNTQTVNNLITKRQAVPCTLKNDVKGCWPSIKMWWVGSENGLFFPKWNKVCFASKNLTKTKSGPQGKIKCWTSMKWKNCLLHEHIKNTLTLTQTAAARCQRCPFIHIALTSLCKILPNHSLCSLIHTFSFYCANLKQRFPVRLTFPSASVF